MKIHEAIVTQWGNSLGVRIGKKAARTAELEEGMSVRITASPGRIIIEKTDTTTTLERMLVAFDPARHGEEVMVLDPVGREIL